MTYYFSLNNTNVKDFWSDKTIFGGAVVLIAPDEYKSHMLFKCDFVRKRNNADCSVFKIELEPNEVNKYKHDDRLRIELANVNDNSNPRSVTWTSLHTSDDFGGNIEESYHYYHFAVNLKEKLILTNGREEPVRSIRIRNILSDNRETVELPVSNEGLMCRPDDSTIFYKYSVRLPDKYVESFLIGRESFVKVLYTSDSAMDDQNSVLVIMYRSINGPKGLKDSMGLEIWRPSLKNFWQPETNWLYKPFSLKPVKPECNINVETFFPKDFIPPYSVADVGAGILEDMRRMSMFESDNRVRIPKIKEVIFNKPATVVYWKDGTKTTVKCGNDEASFDREKAVAMCFLKKMFKPSIKSHWLDVINDAIQAADDKIAQVEADKAEKARIKAENIAKAEEARRKKAEKKVKELQSEIQKLETKSLEEMDSEVEGKDEFEEKYKDVPVKASKNEVSEEYIEKIFDQAEKENKKWAERVDDKGKKNKIDQDLLLECIKEKLTIDEIAEMNSWDKAAVARMYYKITGTKPEKKPNTYSELDALFEQGVSVDAAARRTSFSKKIVAMRYAKLQNKKDKE